MLVQALAAFAQNRLQKQLHDVAFEERPVPYFLAIDSSGNFIGMVPRFAAVRFRAKAKPGKAAPAPKQRAMDYSVPRSPVTLTSGTYALLGLGELKYVLGAGAWTEPKNTGRDAERLQAFVTRLQEAFDATRDGSLAACLRFYESPSELEKARKALKDAVPGSYVALQVDNTVLTDAPAVQSWWQSFYEAACSGRAEVSGECLVTGVVGPITPTHPQIKYTTNIGGKAGVALMSFNAPSFTSYGWEQNANSPVSADAALKYTMALNEMLRPGSPYRRDDIKRLPSGKSTGVAYVFWLRQDAALNPGDLVQGDGSADTISQVRRVLERDRRAWVEDENLFHMVALSATGSRLIVRSSITELLTDAVQNVLSWWEGLQMKPLAPDQFMEAPFFWQLKFALERKGEPTEDRVAMLWNRALAGNRRPLGSKILTDVLGRMRVDKSKRMDLAALGLLRLSLNDIYEREGKGRPMESELDPKLRDTVAYVLGNLLALHDGLQYATFKLAGEQQPNATVADRFYTLLMNSPGAGEASMTKLGRVHLRKLRNLQGGRKLAGFFESEIAKLSLHIRSTLPSTFNLQDKGHFALGFYHQKASRGAAIPDSRKSSDSKSVDEMPVTEVVAEPTPETAESFFEEMEQ